MKYSLIIQSAPYSSQATLSAVATAKELLIAGHDIERVFFYQDGVYNASTLVVPSQDIEDIPKAWVTLINEYALDAVVCVSSALQRGILSQSEAERYERGTGNMHESFQLGGLGLMVDALCSSERTLCFGD